jgi:hypothetical protein
MAKEVKIDPRLLGRIKKKITKVENEKKKETQK